SRPKAECRPRARAAKRQWQRSKPRGAPSPLKCGARFSIFNKARPCSNRQRKVCRRPMNLLRLRRQISPPVWEHSSISCKPQPTARRGAANSPRSPTNVVSVTRLVFGIAIVWFAHTSDAITLEGVLNSTLEKNPAIQQAKANLERAAGRRLVLRSIVWPNLKLNLPAGVQGGHRAGENSTKVFGFARGSLTQPLFNTAIPPSLRRGDVEVLIA